MDIILSTIFLYRFKTEEEALRRANDTERGLASKYSLTFNLPGYTKLPHMYTSMHSSVGQALMCPLLYAFCHYKPCLVNKYVKRHLPISFLNIFVCDF